MKEFVNLIPFKEDRMICPECMKTYPKFRLPLLTICVDCPNEETRRKNQEFEEKCRCNYCKLMENILSLNDENK